MPELPELPPIRPAIGRWRLDVYVQLLRPWVIGAAVILGAVVLMTGSQQEPISLALAAAFLVWIGGLIARCHGGTVEATAAGVMTGAILGALTSVLRFIIAPAPLMALNIVSETLLTAAIGLLLAVTAYIFTTRIIQRTP